ncbi:MAG: triose-phosphate isomerase [Xanthomonadaceae bacterium]|nr:triose-phosphate isomerase [Xanthomonadaceae bacterium]
MRRLLVAGNWKMHGSRDMAAALIGDIVSATDNLQAADVIVCPPFPFLGLAQKLLADSPVALGGQNISEHQQGAYTGEVSAPMLVEFGCRFVIVGHSERRTLYGENDASVARKFAAAQRSKLIPILCVGETLEERERGETEAVVLRQVQSAVDVAGVEAFADAVVAYEPVWAIGTGRTASPEQAQEVHALIRQKISEQDDTIAGDLRILYGGSVKASNAVSLFGMPDIDGGLIGGASLDGDEFLSICRARG